MFNGTLHEIEFRSKSLVFVVVIIDVGDIPLSRTPGALPLHTARTGARIEDMSQLHSARSGARIEGIIRLHSAWTGGASIEVISLHTLRNGTTANGTIVRWSMHSTARTGDVIGLGILPLSVRLGRLSRLRLRLRRRHVFDQVRVQASHDGASNRQRDVLQMVRRRSRPLFAGGCLMLLLLLLLCRLLPLSLPRHRLLVLRRCRLNRFVSGGSSSSSSLLKRWLMCCR